MAQQQMPRQFDFEQIDADAVCERCGTVNPEETLLCKTCGNNLRDQRARRIGQEQGAEVAEPGPNRVRIFTGVLTTLGILTVLAAAYSIPNIESWMVSVQTTQQTTGTQGLWSGANAAVYDDLLNNLTTYPSSRAKRQDAIENPIDETSYNGRYVIAQPDRLRGQLRIIGEANCARRGDNVHFVVVLDDHQELSIRGVARLVSEDGGMRPEVRNTGAVRVDGQTFPIFGYATQLADGGHACYGQTTLDDQNYGALAFRIR